MAAFVARAFAYRRTRDQQIGFLIQLALTLAVLAQGAGGARGADGDPLTSDVLTRLQLPSLFGAEGGVVLGHCRMVQAQLEGAQTGPLMEPSLHSWLGMLGAAPLQGPQNPTILQLVRTLQPGPPQEG